MKFSDIPGHDDLKQRLIAMVAGGRLPHALLFEGPAGSAKMMLARAFVQYIHCTGRGAGDSDSCGRCPSCIQHTGFNHPDTFYSFPVIKKGDAPVSDMFMKEWKIMLSENPLMDFQHWTALLDNVNAQPRIYVSEGHEIIRRLNVTAVASEYKVVLMWLPEKMQTECANKILKIVEEPFTDSMFVMVSDSPRAILPTIYSRLQRISVSRYSNSDVARFLVESEGVADALAGDIASISEGNLIRAKHLLATKDTSNAWLDMFAALMRLAYQRKVKELKAWSAEIASSGREQAMSFLTYCLRLVRENFVLNINTPQLNALTSSEAAFCARFSPFVNERNVERIMNLFDEAIADIAANANGKIVLFDVAVRMCMLIKL